MLVLKGWIVFGDRRKSLPAGIALDVVTANEVLLEL